MKLSCADFTWPLLPHQDVLRLIHSLDIEGLDLGLFVERSHIRPEIIRRDIPMWAGILRERIRGAGLESEREAGVRLFLAMLELARRLEAPGMTILPGARFGDEPGMTRSRVRPRVSKRGSMPPPRMDQLGIRGHP